MKITHAEYLAIKAVSSSLLQHVKRSPAHAREALENPSAPTPAQQNGTRLHSAILEPDVFQGTFKITPAWDARTLAGKQAKQDWQSENPGKIGLSHSEFSQVLRIVTSVYDHPVAAHLLVRGESEVSIVHRDLLTGVMLKCRPDHLQDNIIVDVKTTEDASPRAFAHSILKFNYHMQAAFYLDLVTAATEVQMDHFVFIAVEKKPPFAVATYELDAESLERGRELVKKNLELWLRCVEKGVYPSYSNDIEQICIPTWGFNE